MQNLADGGLVTRRGIPNAILSDLRSPKSMCPMPENLKDPRFLKVILDSIADGVFTIDHDKRITSFNRAAERITGVPATKALKNKCYEVLRSDLCQENCVLDKALQSEAEVRDMPARIINDSGDTMPVSVSLTVLRNKEGNASGAVETFHDLSTIEYLRKELTQNYSFEDIISKSRVLNKFFNIIPDVAESESTVLIQGPFGSGRELLARVIHRLSPRKDYNYVQINCGSLPSQLFEAELFGCIKGVFPDAKQDKTGKLVLADKGTVYFNEIGELPLPSQVKILRLLQTGEYEPLGSEKTLKANVRVIASANRDLKELVAQGRFRDDLYFRLTVVKFDLPPLKDRREDIPYLAEHFISRFNARKGKKVLGVSPDAMSILLRYDFPGNIRQLEGIIEYGFAVCQDHIIEVEHLPEELQNLQRTRPLMGSAIKPYDYPSEPTRIREILRRNRGHLGRSCAELGFHRTTLWRKMKQYGISKEEFKGPF